MTAPDPSILAALDSGAMDPAGATPLTALDSLLDPSADLPETGWCRLASGVGYVAVRTAMRGVSAEMVDWWFGWHADDPLRYRIWYPSAHFSISMRPGNRSAAKPFWGDVHFPVEDVGLGEQTIRIAFQPPSRLGFTTDALDRPTVGTIVCGFAGDPKRMAQATVMAHVFLRSDEGLVLRSRFWLGAALRPEAPAPVAAVASWLLNRAVVRRRVIPGRLPYTLARHCAIEYAHLAGFLPELYAHRYRVRQTPGRENGDHQERSVSVTEQNAHTGRPGDRKIDAPVVVEVAAGQERRGGHRVVNGWSERSISVAQQNRNRVCRAVGNGDVYNPVPVEVADRKRRRIRTRRQRGERREGSVVVAQQNSYGSGVIVGHREVRLAIPVKVAGYHGIRARARAAKGGQLEVRYIGYDEPAEWFDAHDATQLQWIKPHPTFPIGAAVEVEWQGKWYPAKVLKVDGGVHFIHYIEDDSSWDEWVSSKRIRAPRE